MTDGVVIAVDESRAELRVADRSGMLSASAIGWTGRKRPDRLLEVGDVIRVRVLQEEGGDELDLALEQEPEAEAALIAIVPSTGEIVALVGGFDFSRSEFDRATQARRQAGSLFKPFVYAAALDRDWTLADSILDEPTVFLDPRKPVPYQPENFSRDYYGTVTLRTALEKSVNIATVKLLENIGCDAVIDTARRLGVRSRLRPYASLALGAFELSLLEVTSAYGAFANQGLLMEPHWVREVSDRDGRTLYRAKPGVVEAVSPQVAYLMNQALSGVVERGTGKRAGAALARTLAGKTGTTDDYTDAWFVGYSSDLVVGVWVGHDGHRSLGDAETGARAALPIWTRFMREALEGVPDSPFPIPPGIRKVTVDARTGLRPGPRAACEEIIVESFVERTEPTGYCTESLQDKLLLPYPFQRYALDAEGALEIPGNELDRLLAREREVWLDRESGILEARGPEGVVTMPVSVLPDTTGPDGIALDDRFDAASWTGTDGRAARAVWFEDRTTARRSR